MFQFRIGKQLEKAMRFSKNFFLQKKRFYGHVECSFDKPAEKFWTESPEKIGSKSESDWKKTCFFERTFVFQNDPPVSKKAVVTDPPK